MYHPLHNQKRSSVANDRIQKTTEENKSQESYRDDQQQATITTKNGST